MTSKYQATDLVGNWLNAFKRTSPSRDHALIGEARFTILRKYLDEKGQDRFTDLPLDEQVAFCKSVGIEVPLSLVSAALQTPYTPGERQAVAERPQTNPIDAFKEKAKAKAQARWKAEKEADERGEFWTVVGAYYPDYTFLLVYQGLLKPDMRAAFDSQHTDAHMHLEPTTLIGTMSEVRCEAARQFQGKSTTDLRIRVLVKDRNPT